MISGDTPIAVLDSRGEIALREVRPNDWVWSFGPNLRPVPRKIVGCRMIAFRSVGVEVVFQTQGQRQNKSISCSPDQSLRLRNGTFTQARCLVIRHRVLSIEREENSAGYRRLYYTGRKAPVLEHRLVLDIVESDLHAHHVDEVKTNNVPSNLVAISAAEHNCLHPWTAEQIAKREKTRLSRYAGRIPSRQGVEIAKRLHFDRDWAEQVLRRAGGKPTVFRDEHGYDYTSALKALERAGVDWRAIRGEYNNRGELILPLIEVAKQCTTLHEAAKILGVNFYRAKEILAADNNHMIVQVRTSHKPLSLYVVEVDGADNFLANGVCVRAAGTYG